MKVQDYLEKMTKIHTHLLNYLDDETNNEIFYQNLIDIFSEMRIHDNRHEFKSLLYLLIKISKNHHRSTNFFNKIDRILSNLKNDMKKYFTNSELFHIFKRNKRVLLFLLEEQIMVMDEFFVKKIMTDALLSYYLYPQYFLPEIKPFVNEKWFPKSKKWLEKIEKEIPDDFLIKRKEGENNSFICELIRKDLIDDFIVYVNKNLYPLDSRIKSLSICETNSFLLRYGATLIEYAVFFGSIQIFNYLRLNNVQLTPSLWFYAIHGKNADIIHILEENQIDIDDEIQNVFKETIKCHHNDFANYFKDKYLLMEPDCINNCLKYYNFNYMQNDLINESLFCTLCTYDYFILVDFFLREKCDVITDIVIYILYNVYTIINLIIFNDIHK